MYEQIQPELAYQQIQDQIVKTPVEYSPKLSQIVNGEVFLKLESVQKSGSFKYRGALNKILSISKEERQQHQYIAASTGNHAAGFATVMRELGLQGLVLMPESVAKSKFEYVQSLGVDVELFGKNSLYAEIEARRRAEEEDYVLVHPYNDPYIIAGQGTIGIELQEQLPDAKRIVIPVGGGGLFGGIAHSYREQKNKPIFYGVQPEMSPEMYMSLQEGRIITEDISQPTLSDGTAGGMETGSITFDLCKDYVSEIFLLTEHEIADSILWMLEHHQLLIEGSAALGIALIRKRPELFRGQQTVSIICGKRISFDKLIGLLKNKV